MAMMPASVITMATTKASRGRSMKIPENIRSGPRHDVGRYDLAVTHLVDSLDYHQLARFEAVSHNYIASLLDPECYATLLDLLLCINDQNIAACLIEEDRGLGNCQGQSRRSPFDGDADDSTGS